MAQYGKKAQSKVKKTMHERKHGTLKLASMVEYLRDNRSSR